MFKDTFRQPDIKETKAHEKLDSIILYDKIFFYPKRQRIQYLDSYVTDFVFVNEFPKVLEEMSKKLSRQEFREMLKCASRTNRKLYKDGELLHPEAARLIQEQWHGYLLHTFLGKDSDKYIIRGDYFKENDSITKIRVALKDNRTLCSVILHSISSDIDYKISRDRNFMQWLSSYSREKALSKTASVKYD